MLSYEFIIRVLIFIFLRFFLLALLRVARKKTLWRYPRRRFCNRKSSLDSLKGQQSGSIVLRSLLQSPHGKIHEQKIFTARTFRGGVPLCDRRGLSSVLPDRKSTLNPPSISGSAINVRSAADIQTGNRQSIYRRSRLGIDSQNPRAPCVLSAPLSSDPRCPSKNPPPTIRVGRSSHKFIKYHNNIIKNRRW